MHNFIYLDTTFTDYLPDAIEVARKLANDNDCVVGIERYDALDNKQKFIVIPDNFDFDDVLKS